MSPKDTTRFETKPDHQAQFDWKESINFKTKDNQRIPLIQAVPLLYYSRFIIMHNNE